MGISLENRETTGFVAVDAIVRCLREETGFSVMRHKPSEGRVSLLACSFRLDRVFDLFISQVAKRAT
jgi:hypothetical protein